MILSTSIAYILVQLYPLSVANYFIYWKNQDLAKCPLFLGICLYHLFSSAFYSERHFIVQTNYLAILKTSTNFLAIGILL